MRREIAIAAAVASMVLLGSCGGSTAKSSGPAIVHPAAVNSTDANYAASQTWKSQNQEIIANRVKAHADQVAKDGVVVEVSDFGPYLSQPVDVVGNGDYDIILGPLSAADAKTTFVGGITLPPDIAFNGHPEHALSVYKGDDGQMYGKLILHVSNFVNPYSGLTLWTQ